MIYEETQYAAWWVFVILVVVGLVLPVLFTLLARLVAGKGSRIVAAVLLVVAAATLLLGLGLAVATSRMTTEVGDGQVRVTYGWLPVHTRIVPADRILAVEAVTYEPMADYGGWGIRGREGDRVLSQKGYEGVRLTLAQEGTLLIGSQRPAELAEAVNRLRAALLPG